MPNSDLSYNIFQQDLDAYSAAVKSKDFREANIFANRIMSNAYLLDAQNFGIVGFVLKELANDGTILQQSKNQIAFSDFAKEASKITGKIVSISKKELIDMTELWDIYGKTLSINRKAFMSKSENLAYKKPDTSFSKEAIKKLMKILEEYKETLLYPSNHFLRGLLNELSRLIKNHTLDNDDAHFLSILIMLQRIDEYVKTTSVVNEFSDRAAKEVLPLIEETLELYKTINPDNQQTEKIDALLWKLIKLWRLYFIRFMELESRVPIREERVVEEPIKSKLVDAITKQIETQVGSE